MPFAKSFTLNDGHSIPWVAIGTGTAVFGRDAEATIKQAIEVGVTHLDTAQSYKNEETVGVGIAQGGVPRENLFVTTKLGELPQGKTVADTLRESLAKLGLEYVNLFLIHSPLQHKDLVSVWKGMVECQKAGLAKSIGVSNFRKDQLETIVAGGSIVPAVNQIEFHPYLAKASAPLLEYAAQKKIIIASYAGLTPITRHTSGPLNPILGTIRERLIKERGAPVTEAQVLLKWVNQIGVVSITTSSKTERVKEYLDVAALPDLTEEEVKLITEIDYHHRAFGHTWSERP